MLNSFPRLLRYPLRSLYRNSIYGALALMMAGSLVVPAVLGAFLMLGLREERDILAQLEASLQRYADIVAVRAGETFGAGEPADLEPLVRTILRDEQVVSVRIERAGRAPLAFGAGTPQAAGGELHRAARDITLAGSAAGRIEVAMDDRPARAALREKQRFYGAVMAVHLGCSLLLILFILRQRIVRPLRRLMHFSDRLSGGDFDTPLRVDGPDEIGRLGRQLDRMRGAVKQLFDDIGQREARFRTIVMQVPGAVFRFRPGGHVEFISDRVEAISGYPSVHFQHQEADVWAGLIHEDDAARQAAAIGVCMRECAPYETEYRIRHADGGVRWVAESGRPHSAGDGLVLWVDGILTDITQRKAHEMRIAALVAEQSAIIENVMFGVLFVRDRTIQSANRRAEEMLGYTPGGMVGLSTASGYANDEEFASSGERQYAALARGEYFVDERLYRKADGSLFWVQLSGRAIDPSAPHAGSIWVFTDITERRESEEKLRLAAKVFDISADGIVVHDPQGYTLMVNQAFTRITGYTEQEVIGRRPQVLENGREDAHAVWDALVANGTWHGEMWHRRKDGEPYLESLTMSAVRDRNGDATQYVAVFSDITVVREAQQKMDHLAHHDALTGLPNRLLFNDRLAHAMTRATRDGEVLALLFIDLDRFKNVNDTLGHHIGDELLQLVAAGLSARLRDGDTLARLGGDEFILMLENVDGHYGTATVAGKLMEVFDQPFVIDGHELFVTCSVGISLYPGDGTDLNVLIRNADVAMYQAKAQGRNAFRFYSPEMDGEGVQRLRLESLLRRAIERDEIFVQYQPQVDIDSGALLGVEALVRWRHPDLGLVPPVRFIPIAEDSGFINQLGKWVLAEACRQMVRWDEQGLRVPKIAVNVSVKQFERGSIVATVAGILGETGLEPARLQLEVTESVIMDTGDALAFINDLHDIGVGLAIDDFGTGYSSLAYLKQMPVQTLKIDRSFIKDIPEDRDDEAIAIAIIQLGKSLNLSVIAEGVETEEQAAFLRRHGCHAAQGYHYSKPLMADDLFGKWQPAMLPA
jgi:diguanylate cyclase (GGDEF)-like protein/PAS domain S-box-containing protein